MADLISVSAAWQLVSDEAIPSPVERCLAACALDRVLAETVVGTEDVPAFDKSMVDGVALLASDITANSPPHRLKVIETIFAGAVPKHSVQTGKASRIMTGAPIPRGADAVVMVEQTRAIDGVSGRETVEIQGAEVRAGQHILRRGAAYQAGRRVIPAGKRLRPVELGVLAELGHHQIAVYRQPTVTLIQTGDELVELHERPKPGQIRNSNGPMLEALVKRSYARSRNLGIVRDTAEALRQAIESGLSDDVLVLSGGVSQGDRDLVPGVLQDAGVETVFHKVSLRPGKPLWFGVKHHPSSNRKTLVFGLPGNPVSGLVCFQLFVAPALNRLAGCAGRLPRIVAQLSEAFALKGQRPAYWPGSIQYDPPTGLPETTTRVAPLPWLGSADPFALVNADCLIFFPKGNHRYAAGDLVDCRWLL